MKQKGICMKRIIYITIACAFLSVSFAKAQVLTLKECLEEGLQNNYSLRIIHNEEQISKNNATLGNAGYLPTLDFSAGYTGNLDNIETKARATGEITKNNGVYDQTVNVGLNLNWTIFDGFNISTTYKQLKELERQGETNTRIAIEDFIAALTSEYYNFIQQKIRLKNFHYAMSLSKERLRIAEASHLVGKFSGLDYQQAKVDFNADSVDQADAGNLYQKKDDAARFILVADSKEAAHGVCEKFILDQWDVKQRTVKLPDNCGRISLTPGSDESIFYTVSFNALKNFKEPDMTVVIVPEEYMDGDNLAIDQYFPARWTEKCPNCGHKWKTFASGPYTCSECGHKFD